MIIDNKAEQFLDALKDILERKEKIMEDFDKYLKDPIFRNKTKRLAVLKEYEKLCDEETDLWQKNYKLFK
ncbi:MAG: hypothetical protein A2252_00080 [Elusimicrobia bacterium RIFOXYA2_FULL_39_19]|nr:MAG: hypothetical protein A2252_00080 [Elusimicrobia bacterium RIFOXYA2_FULL_39_19]